MKPNILLILADDLGFSDLGCFGGEIPTPNLDLLGREGVRLSSFYNTARCSPSRASLLSGLHPHQTGIGVLTRPDLPSGYEGNLNPDVRILPEMLAEEGYSTGMFGKWHLASDVRTPNDSWPTRKGFSSFFGTLAGCSSYFDPQTLTRGEQAASDASDDPDFYYTTAIADRAIEWLHAQDTSAPFFLYLAFTAPHWPLHALPEDVDAVRGLFDEGWDILRERRLAALASEGVISPGTRLSDRDPSQPAWDDAESKAWQIGRMEAYAAQVVALDRAIGAVLTGLAESGQLDNTLVLFLSDNGASAEELPIGEWDSFMAKDLSMREGTRSGEPVAIGNNPGITPGAENTYSSYGVPWANLSNAPLRKYKRWVHEGGISTPLIVRWPQGGLADGAVIADPAQLVDIVPTILDATQIEPTNAEGRSILPLLRGEPVSAETLYWEHIGNAAVRRGHWKLVRAYPGDWELYDIDADRTELNDLAMAEPQVVAELAADWQTWADRVGVLPWDAMLTRYEVEGIPLIMAEE